MSEEGLSQFETVSSPISAGSLSSPEDGFIAFAVSKSAPDSIYSPRGAVSENQPTYRMVDLLNVQPDAEVEIIDSTSNNAVFDYIQENVIDGITHMIVIRDGETGDVVDIGYNLETDKRSNPFYTQAGWLNVLDEAMEEFNTSFTQAATIEDISRLVTSFGDRVKSGCDEVETRLLYETSFSADIEGVVRSVADADMLTELASSIGNGNVVKEVEVVLGEEITAVEHEITLSRRDWYRLREGVFSRLYEPVETIVDLNNQVAIANTAVVRSVNNAVMGLMTLRPVAEALETGDFVILHNSMLERAQYKTGILPRAFGTVFQGLFSKIIRNKFGEKYSARGFDINSMKWILGNRVDPRVYELMQHITERAAEEKVDLVENLVGLDQRIKGEYIITDRLSEAPESWHTEKRFMPTPTTVKRIGALIQSPNFNSDIVMDVITSAPDEVSIEVLEDEIRQWYREEPFSIKYLLISDRSMLDITAEPGMEMFQDDNLVYDHAITFEELSSKLFGMYTPQQLSLLLKYRNQIPVEGEIDPWIDTQLGAYLNNKYKLDDRFGLSPRELVTAIAANEIPQLMNLHQNMLLDETLTEIHANEDVIYIRADELIPSEENDFDPFQSFALGRYLDDLDKAMFAMWHQFESIDEFDQSIQNGLFAWIPTSIADCINLGWKDDLPGELSNRIRILSDKFGQSKSLFSSEELEPRDLRFMYEQILNGNLTVSIIENKFRVLEGAQSIDNRINPRESELRFIHVFSSFLNLLSRGVPELVYSHERYQEWSQLVTALVGGIDRGVNMDYIETTLTLLRNVEVELDPRRVDVALLREANVSLQNDEGITIDSDANNPTMVVKEPLSLEELEAIHNSDWVEVKPKGGVNRERLLINRDDNSVLGRMIVYSLTREKVADLVRERNIKIVEYLLRGERSAQAKRNALLEKAGKAVMIATVDESATGD